MGGREKKRERARQTDRRKDRDQLFRSMPTKKESRVEKKLNNFRKG